MDELNISFILFSVTDKMEDPEVFDYFVQYTLTIATSRVRDIIFNFSDTFATPLSYLEKEIDYFVKESHGDNSARTENAKVLLAKKSIFRLKSLFLEIKYW